MRGIHDTVTLELDPDSIGARPREDDLELDSRSAVGEKRVLVHHVDQVVARHEHVAPHSKVLLESALALDDKAQLRPRGRDGPFGDRLERHSQVRRRFRRIVAVR